MLTHADVESCGVDRGEAVWLGRRAVDLVAFLKMAQHLRVMEPVIDEQSGALRGEPDTPRGGQYRGRPVLGHGPSACGKRRGRCKDVHRQEVL